LPANGNKNGHKPDNLATVMTEVSERVTVLVKEELELAKAEVQQKVSSLSKGLIAGGVGTVLALLFIPFALLTLAIALDDAFNNLWLGFLIVTVLLLALMGGAFLFAWRKIKVGAPVPKTAIEEAKKIRETVSAKGNGNGAGHPAAVIPPPVVTAPAVPAAVVAAPAPTAITEAPAAIAVVEPPAAIAVVEPPAATEEAAASTTETPAVAEDAPAPIADPPTEAPAKTEETETADAPTATFDAATGTPDDATGSE
jgi:uncharacterized membrane protein YqjE